ncbi:DUF397 domain-containing protein [Streptomyces caatingaensis]|uniref:DUF397 domain-containing protein n=1 Tax=Streptomyces caatingaensis TaxID=1678637 RepID=UPI00099DD965|nr:DUF397 domain-containing protein [Streptomyces caatingaensis]
MSATWRKSSYSDNIQECVEIADTCPGPIRIRDSKLDHATPSPCITATPSPWTTFLHALRAKKR